MSLYTNGEGVGTPIEEIDKLWTALTLLVDLLAKKGVVTHTEFFERCVAYVESSAEEMEQRELQKEFPFMKE